MTATRIHLVWDWNGTLLDDFGLMVRSTNTAFATVGGSAVSAAEHRLWFRRPIIDFYAEALGRPVDEDEFARLDKIFHDAYRTGLDSCGLAADAWPAIGSWDGTQSLLSMWFHDELVPAVRTHGLTDVFHRVDGLRDPVGGGRKTAHLIRHLEELGISGDRAVLVGDSIDDAEAAESVGAACVLYTGGVTDADRLRASGRPVASTLVEAVALAKMI